MSGLNINPKIARAISEMNTEQGALLDVETVYSKMIELYGDEIFRSERFLAQIAVKQKIKLFLRNSHQLDAMDHDDLFSVGKIATPPTLSIRQPDGRYAYVLMRNAMSSDIEAAIAERQRNIENAEASLKHLVDKISPAKAIMDVEGISYGEAEKRISNNDPPQADKKSA